MLSELRPAIVSTVLFTLLLGLGYPLAITGISERAFPYQANGSLVRDASGQVVGSALIAQGFAKDEYLHPRPSAAGNGYDATSSSGSNYGPLDPNLAKRIAGDAASLRASTGHQEIPDDAITTSGSGLDPDISYQNAFDQALRVARVRHLPVAAVMALVRTYEQGREWGFLGEPSVNVLELNIALEALR